MTTRVDFVPSAISVFQFLATLANGVQYNISTPRNAMGERYYITVTDLSGNLIVHRSIVQSGPAFTAMLTWDDGVATVALTVPHNVPVGNLANARIAQTDTEFDGLFQMLATGAQTLTFPLAADPGESGPVTGTLDFPVDLLSGYGIGSLYFHADTQQFEY